MGTGTLEVPKQSILNLLFPGHTRCSGCVHSSATAQAVGTEFRASSRLVAALAAGRGVCVPWLAGRWLPGDRIPQPTPQDVNLDPDLPCCVSQHTLVSGIHGHPLAVQLLPSWHALSSDWVQVGSCPQPHDDNSCWLCPRMCCAIAPCLFPVTASSRAAGSKLLQRSYNIPLPKGSPPGADALCYQNDTSALSLQIIQEPELVRC